MIGPCPQTLPPGDYVWCGCGEARRMPLCDGHQAGHGCARARRFTVTSGHRRLWLCVCQQTRHPPYCDGQHNRLNRK